MTRKLQRCSESCVRDVLQPHARGDARRAVSPLALCAAALALFAPLAGCGGPEARAPNPTRPIDERRAIEVIRRAIAEDGVQPAPGRQVELASGKAIRIDVSVQGRDFGVAYITEEDARTLGSAIPPPNKPDEKLRIARAGAEGEIRIVLLYENNYRYDDHVGEGHERTAITAEHQLSRDVQDFVTYARTQKYK